MRILAFDFGASSGRAMIGELKEGKITLKEIHRFPNEPVSINGTLYWDVLRLFHEVKQGIIKAKNDGGFDSIGIDTWGVDFGILDDRGDLMSNPVHYRDHRTDGMIEKTRSTISDKEMYGESGLQFMNFNTVYQLKYLVDNQKEKLDRCDKILFMPDLFAYMLTGAKRTEYTILSTSGLLNQKTAGINEALCHKLGIPTDIFAPLIQPGESYGNLSKEICEELGVKPVPVVAVCTHDTASAIVAVPNNSDEKVYLSSGTWSLFGTELTTPILTEQSREANFTNERGYGESVRYLKNIMGLWLIQECKRSWKSEGKEYSFGEIADMAAKSELKGLIDVNDERFLGMSNMPETIKGYCREKGIPVPTTEGEVARVVYESLAFKYGETLRELEKITGKKVKVINVVGGGCNATLLNELMAKYCGTEVWAGPIEATALGNIAVQMIALGKISSLSDARDIIRDSFPIERF